MNFKIIAIVFAFGAILFAVFAISGLVNFGETLTRPLAGSPGPNGSEIIASANATATALEIGTVGFLILGLAAMILWRWNQRS